MQCKLEYASVKHKMSELKPQCHRVIKLRVSANVVKIETTYQKENQKICLISLHKILNWRYCSINECDKEDYTFVDRMTKSMCKWDRRAKCWSTLDFLLMPKPLTTDRKVRWEILLYLWVQGFLVISICYIAEIDLVSFTLFTS